MTEEQKELKALKRREYYLANRELLLEKKKSKNKAKAKKIDFIISESDDENYHQKYRCNSCLTMKPTYRFRLQPDKKNGTRIVLTNCYDCCSPDCSATLKTLYKIKCILKDDIYVLDKEFYLEVESVMNKRLAGKTKAVKKSSSKRVNEDEVHLYLPSFEIFEQVEVLLKEISSSRGMMDKIQLFRLSSLYVDIFETSAIYDHARHHEDLVSMYNELLIFYKKNKSYYE